MAGLRSASLLLFVLSAGEAASKDTWIEARSEHFTLTTDAGKGTAENILEDLENLRRLIAQLKAPGRHRSSEHLRPENPYLSFILGRLYARQENYSAAREI